MFGGLNAFGLNDIFNLQWIYQDITPSYVKEHLYVQGCPIQYYLFIKKIRNQVNGHQWGLAKHTGV